jgi:hypothetical protein
MIPTKLIFLGRGRESWANPFQPQGTYQPTYLSRDYYRKEEAVAHVKKNIRDEWKIRVEDISRGRRLKKTFSKSWQLLSPDFLVKRGVIPIYMDRTKQTRDKRRLLSEKRSSSNDSVELKVFLQKKSYLNFSHSCININILCKILFITLHNYHFKNLI